MLSVLTKTANPLDRRWVQMRGEYPVAQAKRFTRKAFVNTHEKTSKSMEVVQFSYV